MRNYLKNSLAKFYIDPKMLRVHSAGGSTNLSKIESWPPA